MSDRITDKEQFIDSILALYGALLSDEDEEEEGDGNGSQNAAKRLRKEKLLELPADAKAEYLTRTFDEAGVEILKRAIEQDIHKFSHIPCMTDESFGGTSPVWQWNLSCLAWKISQRLRPGIIKGDS